MITKSEQYPFVWYFTCQQHSVTTNATLFTLFVKLMHGDMCQCEWYTEKCNVRWRWKYFLSVCFVINPILTIIFNANYTGNSASCNLLVWTIHADIIEFMQIFKLNVSALSWTLDVQKHQRNVLDFTLLFNKCVKMKFTVKRLKQWKLDIQNANFIILIFFVHKFVFLSFTTRISQ